MVPEIVEEWRLDTRRLGRRVLVYERIESTNTHLLAHADDPDNDGLIVLAREQTTGRGQQGRSWLAPGGTSVLLSALVFPPPALRRPVLLTAWAAVSVCGLIQQAVDLEPHIKWPNDVLVRDRKVCGILIEQRATAPDRLATVVGIGLNVRQTQESFRDAGLTEAASLALLCDHVPEALTLARDLIIRLDDELDRLAKGDLAMLETRWRGYLGLVGAPVRVETAKETLQGRLRKLSFQGLELELGHGAIVGLQPEGVQHVFPQLRQTIT
jgi:BirA family biotin operon repressor/biotin-[acetyl-CoA-carboxylase] ligase